MKPITKYPAVEYKPAVFDIYEEGSDPYDNQNTSGTIELAEATYIGGDLYMIPMQIYRTNHPLLLKAVVLISDLCGPGLESWGEICGNNIRTVELSPEGIVRYDDNGRRSPATWDLRAPMNWEARYESN